LKKVFEPSSDEKTIRAAQDTIPCARAGGKWVLAATIIGSSMAFIDGTVVHVALPVLQAELNATVTGVQWIIESYTLFLAALILVGGALGDLLGRRRIFASGVVIFAAASVWCGLAPNIEQLIIARGIQGAGGALLVPGSLAIISASYKDEQRGRAIGTWAGFTTITAALGPVLGGWLIENISWRLIFFINVPLAAVVLGILYRCVPESHDPSTSVRLDWWGALLATTGLGAIVYGLIESAPLGLSHPVVLISLAVGVVALIMFIAVEASSQVAIMPLVLFRSRTFSGVNIITFFLYAALGATLFFFPFNLIQVQGYSATAAGASFLPLVLVIFGLSRWAGGLINRFGARLPLTIGPFIAATGYVLLAVPGVGGSFWETFFPGIIVLGLGMAISIAPLTATVMSAVETRQAGLASGINNAVSRMAMLLAIAVTGILILYVFNHDLDRRVALLEIPPEVQHFIDDQRIRLAGAEIPAGLSSEVSAALKHAIIDSFVTGFRWIMLTAAGLALTSALVAWFTITGQRPDLRPDKAVSLR
jgi:EmrB/QacA subfamily drug resistance transporter